MTWRLVQNSKLPLGTPDGADFKTSPLEPEPIKPPKPIAPPGYKYIWK